MVNRQQAGRIREFARAERARALGEIVRPGVVHKRDQGRNRRRAS